MNKVKLFWHKWTHWEYWPFEVVYFPVFFYWLWLSLRARSLFFFSASNPSIEVGGMLSESKYGILKRIPAQVRAKTLLVSGDTALEKILQEMKALDLTYPVIAKPDVGERGTKVEKIENEQALQTYIAAIHRDFLIQEYVSFPLEFGIFYYRFPNQEKGVVSSIVQKDFLKVKGDGHHTVTELMQGIPRAGFHLDRLKRKWGEELNRIPAEGEVLELEPIGNHCRGTTFLDACAYIDQSLTERIDAISKEVEGFYYGRYDLRCASLEDLKAGTNTKIVELNGAGAEPAHIYHPGASLWKGYKVLFRHWKILFQISVMNHKNGVPYIRFKEVRQRWGAMKRAKEND